MKFIWTKILFGLYSTSVVLTVPSLSTPETDKSTTTITVATNKINEFSSNSTSASISVSFSTAVTTMPSQSDIPSIKHNGVTTVTGSSTNPASTQQTASKNAATLPMTNATSSVMIMTSPVKTTTSPVKTTTSPVKTTTSPVKTTTSPTNNGISSTMSYVHPPSLQTASGRFSSGTSSTSPSKSSTSMHLTTNKSFATTKPKLTSGLTTYHGHDGVSSSQTMGSGGRKEEEEHNCMEVIQDIVVRDNISSCKLNKKTKKITITVKEDIFKKFLQQIEGSEEPPSTDEKEPSSSKTYLVAILASGSALLAIIIGIGIYTFCHRRYKRKNQQHLTEELHTTENGYHDNPTLEVMEVQPEMQEKKTVLNGEFNDSWIVPFDNLVKDDFPDEEDTHL